MLVLFSSSTRKEINAYMYTHTRSCISAACMHGPFTSLKLNLSKTTVKFLCMNDQCLATSCSLERDAHMWDCAALNTPLPLPLPPPAHSQDCEATINVTESVLPINVFADDMTRTCFVCFFGSPPTTNSMTTWTLSGDPIPSSEGMVDDGVLVIFDPAVTFSILLPRILSCSSSAGANTVFVQAVGKLFCKWYMQVPYPVACSLQVHCHDTHPSLACA